MSAEEASSHVAPRPASASASTRISHEDVNAGDGGPGVAAIDMHDPSAPQDRSVSEPAQIDPGAQSEESSKDHVSNLVECLDNYDLKGGDDQLKQLHDLLDKVDGEMLRSAREQFDLVPLFPAARRGVHTAIEKLMKLDAPAASSTDWSDETPLGLACTWGHLQVVRMLLESGVDFNSKDEMGVSPLMRASAAGHVAIVAHLMNAQADALATDEDGWTALHYACCNGQKKAAQVLLKKESGLLNTRDTWKRLTPLGLAMDTGEWEMARWLLERYHGQEDGTIQVDLHMVTMAVRSGKNDTLKLLLDERHGLRDELKPWDDKEVMPLLFDALRRSRETFYMLVEAQAKPGTENRHEATALIKACISRQHEEVKKLLGWTGRVDVNASDRFDETALHKASRLGYPDIVTVLLDQQADPEKRNKEGMTALHIACAAGIDGARPRDSDDSDEHVRRLSLDSDLFESIAGDQCGKVIQALLKAKASPFGKDNENKTAFDHAVRNHREHSTLALLLKGLEQHYLSDDHRRDMDEESELLVWAANKRERHEIIGTLLSHDPDAAKRSSFTKTLLQENSRWTAVEWVVFAGFPLLLLKVLNALPEAEVPRKLDMALNIAGLLSQGKPRTERASKKNPHADHVKTTSEEKKEAEKASKDNPRAARGKTSGFAFEVNRELVLHLLQTSKMTALARKKKTFTDELARCAAEKDDGILDEWKASIIYFRDNKEDGRDSRGEGFDALRCERSVHSVIFKDGPRKAMQDANEDLRRSLKDILAKTKETDKDLEKQLTDHISQIPTDDLDVTFRWVHLPANNVRPPSHFLHLHSSTSCR